MTEHFRIFPLFADAGVPMILLTFPAMAILLIPVIIVEGLLCKRWLQLSTWQAMKSNAISNAVSTIVGLPVAWAIMLAVELGVFGIVDRSHAIQDSHSPIGNIVGFLLTAAWIGPPDREHAWLIPAAVLVLLVPFYFASYWVEYLIVKSMIGMPDGNPPNLAYPRVRIAVRNANLVTYGAMFLATSVWMGASLPRH